MDDIVYQAMLKWPNVPDCYGWLGLDRRGQWHLRDNAAQALGMFQSAQQEAKGVVLRHDKLIEFIHRNYGADAQGRWYFQNGPQRVYVELEATPWIWRVHADGGVIAHTGQAAQVRACLVDEQGHVYLDTTLGFGLVHTLDVLQVAEQLEKGHWQAQGCLQAELPERFAYVLSPQQT